MTNIKEKAYKSNHLKGYLPMNFDIDRHLNEYPPDYNLNRDNLIYLLSLLTRIPARAERHDSEFVNIKAEYLKNRIRDYKKYIDYCLKTGIIEGDAHYQPGKKSKGYKFADKFLTRVASEPIVKYSLVRSERTEREKRNQQTALKYEYLTRHFNSNLSFDYDGAKDLFLDSTMTAQEYNFNLVKLDELHDQQFRYSVDNTAYRFHSPLTNLKSDFRHYVTYGNETLVSVDIRNSQPFFSLCLLDPGFYEKTEGQLSIFSLFPSIHSFPFISLMIRKVKETRMNSSDIQLYRELVLNATLYDYLEREIYDSLGITYDDYRQLKKDFFWGFYGHNRTMGHRDAHLRRLFKNRFPSIYEIFSLLKRKDHKFFPVLLQRIESYLVIEQICARIAQERPFLPLYTIHDSIITTEGNEGYISAIMGEQIELITGHRPQLKIEQWKKN